jgi:hypothetical protein
MKKQIMLMILGLSLTACADDYYYQYGKKIELTKTYEQRAINHTNVDYFMTKNGHKVGVTKEIIVQCEENIDCIATLDKYHLKDMSKLSDKLFVIKIYDDEDIFEFSQKLYNNNAIKLAHPNFIKNRKRR